MMQAESTGHLIVLHNAVVLTPSISFHGGVVVKNGCLAALFAEEDCPKPTGGRIIDCRSGYLVPGFIDLHVHGALEHDFLYASPEEITAAAQYHALAGGTTTLLPTLLSAPLSRIQSAARAIGQARTLKPGPAIPGIHLEGPFINPEFRGAHQAGALQEPRPELLRQLIDLAPALVTLAPELPGGLEAVFQLNKCGIIAAAGHSAASYDLLQEAIERGLRHAVHTFNAAPAFHHREPGITGAVLTLDELSAEIIADGIHSHPAALKLFFRAKKPDRAVLVTDAVPGTGLPDGWSTLGGQRIAIAGGAAHLDGDTLAGSTLTMNRAVARVVATGAASLPEAVAAATLNPARVLGLNHIKGSLEKGKQADLVVLDRSFNVKLTMCGGCILQETTGE